MAELKIYEERLMPSGIGRIRDLLPRYRTVREDPDGCGPGEMDEIVRDIHGVCPPKDFDIGVTAADLPGFETVTLSLSEENEADTRNIRTFHGTYRDLPPSLAAIPGFWAWLAHVYYWKYVVTRAEEESWALTSADVKKNKSIESKLEATIKRDFFCQDESTPGKSLLVNPLSRLWWAGYFLRDDNAADPYANVRLLTESGEGSFASLFVLFASSAASRSHAVALGILSALGEWNDTHDKCFFGRKSIRNSLTLCTSYLNRIGAMRMVDMLSREEIKDILLRQLEKKWIESDPGAD